MSILEWLVALLAVAGSLFVLLGSVALVKLPDFYTRLHGPTKATTLGLGALVLASMAYFNFVKAELSLQQLLIALFLFITAPITAHMLIKAALHLKLAATKQTAGKDKAGL
ncbi:Na+/H+ antiporter subunit G [Rheinheimera mesophila]|uniref:Na+/H+ antiporter subunit G n=1 Tax=Rheinheimera mesophila TaxID=1547515 RepID=A0A3P3QRX8_9GAMM|nr:Na+/H+ antiporter subunit G [Rheinheimera mesophila]KKL01095.1 sodium:proton antiporter [Rheinheimera mesophila]RRJ23957.1 Na+/H+ antiporter subunit G [Rheinheimera mesophila]